jgi:hypothetical protein
VHLLFFQGPKSVFFMREKCKNRIFLVFDAILRDPVTRG